MRIAITLLLLTTTACTAITGERFASRTFNTEPPGGRVEIVDSEGRVVEKGTCPTVIQLKCQDGYMSGADYTAVFSKPGYHDSQMSLESDLNGWYFTNILIPGGLIWLFLVDPLAGGMFEFEDVPDNVVTHLDPIVEEVRSSTPRGRIN